MKSLTALSGYLNSNQPLIIERWLELSSADEELDLVGRLTKEEFRNNMPAALDAFCGMLIVGEDQVEDRLEVEVARHGHHRWKQGFSLLQLIRDWGHFNRVLTERIDEFYLNEPPQMAEQRSVAIRYLADYLTEAASHSVERFDDLRRAEAASLVTDLESTKSQFEEVTRVRGELLRQVAHDIRGGMSSITGASGFLRKVGAEPETLPEMLDILDSGVQSVLKMLESLLDLSRIESGVEKRELSTVDVGKVLEELAHDFHPVAREKELNLVVDGESGLLVETDSDKLRRIAQNLLVNGIKYTEHGEVRIAWWKADEHWTLQIEDTGPGIQDIAGSEVAKELDDEDSARPPVHGERSVGFKGEGIGLTIVKHLCNLLDAGISMESKSGQGTSFSVDFPLRYDEGGSA